MEAKAQTVKQNTEKYSLKKKASQQTDRQTEKPRSQETWLVRKTYRLIIRAEILTFLFQFSNKRHAKLPRQVTFWLSDWQQDVVFSRLGRFLDPVANQAASVCPLRSATSLLHSGSVPCQSDAMVANICIPGSGHWNNWMKIIVKEGLRLPSIAIRCRLLSHSKSGT